MQVGRITALRIVGDTEALAAATREYVKKFPDDASAHLYLTDTAVVEQDAVLLKECHAGLVAWTGDADFLNLMFAAVAIRIDEPELATEILADADPAKGGLAIGYRYRLKIALQANDHETTLQCLIALREQFNVLLDVDAEPEFERFRQSKQYKVLGSPA